MIFILLGLFHSSQNVAVILRLDCYHQCQQSGVPVMFNNINRSVHVKCKISSASLSMVHKYFREYPHNGEDNLEAYFIKQPLPVPRSNSFSTNLYVIKCYCVSNSYIWTLYIIKIKYKVR
jgi:hypothetical protein